MTITNQLNQLIDHTCLKPEATESDLEQLAIEAKDNDFNSICIRSQWVKSFASLYRCSATIDFPDAVLDMDDIERVKFLIGASSLDSKMGEAKQALIDGALELDPVLSLRAIMDQDVTALTDEIRAYIQVIKEYGQEEIWLKPIFSCEVLNDEQIEFSIKTFVESIDPDANINYAYKNSTGFIKAGADQQLRITSTELISMISALLDSYDPSSKIHIKAAGGIKTMEQAQAIIKAAAGRLSHIGTSSGIDIVKR